jgi:hypothetical protein
MISFCTGQSGQHAHIRRAFDFYSTPAIAVEALLEAEHFTPATRFWEPGAGDGAIAYVLRAHGFPVICSDIVERAFPLHFTTDFLAQSKAPAGCTTIITNPLYRNATEFAERSLELVPDVYLLLRLAFYESVPPHRATRASRTSRRPCFSAPSDASAPPRQERSAQLELDCVRRVPLAPRSSRSADSQPHLNQEASNNMAIQTLTSIKRNRSRAERHRGGAARIVAKMRLGATLHQHVTNAGSVWTLSDGTTVNSDVAKIVTGNLNVVGVGDCLFPRVTTVSQSFRWSD